MRSCMTAPASRKPATGGTHGALAGTERRPGGGASPWVVGAGSSGKTPPCGGGSPVSSALSEGRGPGGSLGFGRDPPHGIGRGLAYSQSPWKRGWEWSGSVRSQSNPACRRPDQWRLRCNHKADGRTGHGSPPRIFRVSSGGYSWD